jgi:hypothetical protein
MKNWSPGWDSNTGPPEYKAEVHCIHLSFDTSAACSYRCWLLHLGTLLES